MLISLGVAGLVLPRPAMHSERHFCTIPVTDSDRYLMTPRHPSTATATITSLTL